MDPIKKLLDDIESQTDGSDLVVSMKVVKSVKASKEEVELQDKMHKECDKLYKMLQEISADRQKFWAMVQLRLDSFENDGSGLGYNRETKEIEFRVPNE